MRSLGMVAFATLAVFDLGTVPQPGGAPGVPAVPHGAPPRTGAQQHGAPHANVAPDTFRNVGGFDSIRTDDIQYNLNTGVFKLKDPFTATRTGTEITADRATGNATAKQFHAEGDVVVHQNKAPTANASLAERPSTLTCDVLDVDGGKQLYTAIGRVHFTQAGGRSATADRGTLDDAAHKLHLLGTVHIVEIDRILDADDVVYDTISGDVDAHGNVTIRTPAPTPAPAAPKPTAAPKRRGPLR